jgi:hypothetical protein
MPKGGCGVVSDCELGTNRNVKTYREVVEARKFGRLHDGVEHSLDYKG